MFLLPKLLARLVDEGPLTLIGPDGSRRSFGQPSPHVKPVTIRIHDARVERDILANPRLAIGEAYMDGRVTVEEGDVLDFLRLVTWNGRWERGGNKRKLFKRRAPVWLARLGMRNKVARSKRNVAHHYDLSDRLYDLFLDRDRQYSCAYFTDPANSLDQAQADKKAHIAAKLDLRAGQRVLDIAAAARIAGVAGMPRTLKALLAAGPNAMARVRELSGASQAHDGSRFDVAWRDEATLDYLAPIDDADKFLCVGKNYRQHLAELQRQAQLIESASLAAHRVSL